MEWLPIIARLAVFLFQVTCGVILVALAIGVVIINAFTVLLFGTGSRRRHGILSNLFRADTQQARSGMARRKW